MSLNKRLFIRKVYTFLDMIGELGGLFSALTPMCVLLVSIFQYQSSYQFVMADMMVDRDTSDADLKGSKSQITDQGNDAPQPKSKLAIKRKNDTQWNALKSFKTNLQTFIPKKWLCKCFWPKGKQV